MDEINLADLAITKIQKGAIDDLVDPSLGFGSDDEVKRKITLVAELAFQCLQRHKELRPSMDEVLEVLSKIESGKDDVGNIEKVKVQGAGLSHDDENLSLPLSPDHGVVKLLRNMELTPSPKAVTDKWNSESTTPNITEETVRRPKEARSRDQEPRTTIGYAHEAVANIES
ncbi:hypothetical protein RJT34_25508 [Clitoria ternatea]|uniref:Uncharacterized protein n=1 Tax=Clitoria ternatea TaxID=43366 RepID=A0AAN9FS46_CLITE